MGVTPARAKVAPASACHNGAQFVTQARKLFEEPLPSFNFRLELAAEVFAALRHLVVDTQRKRARSTTDGELEEFAATQPCAPSLRPKSAAYLERAMPRNSNMLPRLVAIGCETYGAARAKVAAEHSASAAAVVDTFGASAPDGLASAVACTKASLLVAPWVHVHGELGLLSPRAFMELEIVCQGPSMVNGWFSVKWAPCSFEYTLQVALRHVSVQITNVRRQLIGGPNRNFWAGMHSTEKLKPNSSVEPVVTMGNYFLAFRAARDSNAFEELLWRYVWADPSKVVGTSAADQTPELLASWHRRHPLPNVRIWGAL